MKMNFIFAIAASFLISALSFIGALTLLLKEKILEKILIILVAFSAGTLIGNAFLHLLPESIEKTHEPIEVFVYVILGFCLFFILEKYLHWRHCHDQECTAHSFSYLNLIGDSVHNFIDGLIIGGSFFVNISLGIITTLTILLHEIPQELGDFGVLLYGGLSKTKTIFYNFLSALTAVLGTIVGYYFSGQIDGFSAFLLPFAAGGFIYIAGSDLIPELHHTKNRNRSMQTLITFLLGIILMYLLASNGGHFHHHH